MRARESPSVAVLRLGGTLGPSDTRRIAARARHLLEASGADVLDCRFPSDRPSAVDLAAVDLAAVDLAAVDALARVALVTRRLGRRMRLTAAPPDLLDLFALAGLSGILPVGRQPAPRRSARRRRRLRRRGGRGARRAETGDRCRGRT